MSIENSHRLVVAISSRALFDLDESHTLFEEQGLEAYQEYQIEHENNILQPGVAYPLVEKLLGLKDPNNQERLVEVILLSRNSADTGLRIFNSIQHYGLNITRAAFSNGQSPYSYVSAFGAHLFLSAHIEDVQNALNSGCAAATIFSSQKHMPSAFEQLRIAFDGDAVLFSDEAEMVFQEQGLEAFQLNEREAAHTPLAAGPFKPFLAALHHIQNLYPVGRDCPIRTALVTARNAPAHERVVRTLRHWGIRIDEAVFLGGMKKRAFLEAFKADFFFDDQTGHCHYASKTIATGHVPVGIKNT